MYSMEEVIFCPYDARLPWGHVYVAHLGRAITVPTYPVAVS